MQCTSGLARSVLETPVSKPAGTCSWRSDAAPHHTWIMNRPAVLDVQDQKQYWAKSQPWQYQPVSVFAEAFARTEQGRMNEAAHDQPHQTAAKEAGLDPLARTRYVRCLGCMLQGFGAAANMQLFHVCLVCLHAVQMSSCCCCGRWHGLSRGLLAE